MSPRIRAYLPFAGSVLAILSAIGGAGLWVLGEARALGNEGNRKAAAIELRVDAVDSGWRADSRLTRAELNQRQDVTDRKIDRVEEKLDAVLLELRRRR